MSLRDTDQSCIYIGIDFGTTYSGIAYSTSDDPDNVAIVKGWPSSGDRSHTKNESKVPTRLSYNGDTIHWGYDIPDGATVVSWFKLLLLDVSELKGYMKRPSEQLVAASQALKKANKTVEEAVADYLGKLWTHALSEMEEDFTEYGMLLQFKVIITVPAIWPPHAIQKMRRAARDAGILDRRPGVSDTILDTVTEPEAAAMATFWTLKKRFTLEPGDIFTVCDIGGGTTDIISYKVSEKSPYGLEEYILGAGGLCGSIFVDHEFENLVRNRMGQSTWNKISAYGKTRMFNEDWEHGIKRNFFDDPTKEWTVQIPSETASILNYGGKRDRLMNGLKISTGELKGVFNNSLDQTRSLINDQKNEIRQKSRRWPRAIVLVGGFGKCKYVLDVLKAEHSKAGIQILSPKGELSDAWTAICRGAALKAQSQGISGLIKSKISRLSYGLKIAVPYNEKTHKALTDKKYIDEYTEVENVQTMEWFIERGTMLSTLESTEKPYFRSWRSFEHLTRIQSMVVYCSDKPEPPVDPADVSVRDHCKMAFTSKITRRDVEDEISPSGKSYVVLRFHVGLDVAGADAQFYVSRNGIKEGKQQVDITDTAE